jgi:two-component system phosphate regulon response regulator PhoB
MPKEILVVDDEQAIRTMLGYTLRRSDYICREAADVNAARVQVAERRPDLMIIDWMLPDSSGLVFTRQLKTEPATRDIPIIMLSARGSEQDKVMGLESGADDYVTKPFSPRELTARIGALLRRVSRTNEDGCLEIEQLVLDPQSHRVIACGTFVPLGPTEFRLLEFFMGHVDRVFTRAQLLDRIWGEKVYVSERSVDVHILRLRQALAPFKYDRFVQTVRNSGYRFSTLPD